MRYVGRTVSNLVVVGLLVGSGLLIYKVADPEDILPDSASTDLKDLFQKYQVCLCNMSLVLRKWGLIHVRKLSSQVSLCSPLRLIKVDSFRSY